MRRREFITLLSSAAAAWPFAVRAQQSAMPVVGFLRSTPRDLSLPLIAAFRQGLMESGFDEGQNVAIEFLYADNQIDRLPGLVDELVRRPENVIVANVLAALAAKNATTTIPILFVTGSDPGQRRSCRQPEPAGRQHHWRELRLRRIGDEAAGDFAPTYTQCKNHCHVGSTGR